MGANSQWKLSFLLFKSASPIFLWFPLGLSQWVTQNWQIHWNFSPYGSKFQIFCQFFVTHFDQPRGNHKKMGENWFKREKTQNSLLFSPPNVGNIHFHTIFRKWVFHTSTVRPRIWKPRIWKKFSDYRFLFNKITPVFEKVETPVMETIFWKNWLFRGKCAPGFQLGDFILHQCTHHHIHSRNS